MRVGGVRQDSARSTRETATFGFLQLFRLFPSRRDGVDGVDDGASPLLPQATAGAAAVHPSPPPNSPLSLSQTPLSPPRLLLIATLIYMYVVFIREQQP